MTDDVLMNEKRDSNEDRYLYQMTYREDTGDQRSKENSLRDGDSYFGHETLSLLYGASIRASTPNALYCTALSDLASRDSCADLS